MILADVNVEFMDELYSEQRELGRDVPDIVSYEAYGSWLREFAKTYFDEYDHYYEREPLAGGWKLIMAPVQ